MTESVQKERGFYRNGIVSFPVDGNCQIELLFKMFDATASQTTVMTLLFEFSQCAQQAVVWTIFESWFNS